MTPLVVLDFPARLTDPAVKFKTVAPGEFTISPAPDPVALPEIEISESALNDAFKSPEILILIPLPLPEVWPLKYALDPLVRFSIYVVALKLRALD